MPTRRRLTVDRLLYTLPARMGIPRCVVKLLLRKSVSYINRPDSIMWRPIDIACFKGHEHCLSTLLAFNADFAAAQGRVSPGCLERPHGLR